MPRICKNLAERAAGQQASREAENLPHLDRQREYRKAYTKVWYQTHKEHADAYKKEWSKRNPDKVREYRKNWAARNPEKVKEYSRRSYQKRKAKELADLFKRCKQEGAKNYGNGDSAGNAPV